MNQQEWNSLCEERINNLAPYVRAMSGGNGDLAQECAIGIFQALGKDPHGNDRFLKNSAKWEMLNYLHRGRSVDNGFLKRDKIRIVHYDHSTTDVMFLMIFKNRMTIPLEDLVIDKITMEGFFDTLTEIERIIVNYKLDGLSNTKIDFRLNISYSRLKKIRKEIRFKINLAFAD